MASSPMKLVPERYKENLTVEKGQNYKGTGWEEGSTVEKRGDLLIYNVSIQNCPSVAVATKLVTIPQGYRPKTRATGTAGTGVDGVINTQIAITNDRTGIMNLQACSGFVTGTIVCLADNNS